MLFTVLEMAFRLSKNPYEQMQLFHLLDAVMDPVSTQQLRAVGPSWAAALPFVGVLVTASKVLRRGNWDLPSLGLACKVMQTVLCQVYGVWKAWLDAEEDVRSSSLGGCAGLVRDPGMGGKEQQQQQRGEHKQQLSMEKKQMLDSLAWAKYCCALGITDVLHDVTWLAVQVARQMLCWEKVKQDTAAGGAAIDVELTRCYLRTCDASGIRFLPAHCTLPLTRQQTMMAADSAALSIVDTLLTQFGSARVVSWARQLRPWPAVDVGSDLEVPSSYDRLGAEITSSIDRMVPGSKVLAALVELPSPLPQITPSQGGGGMWLVKNWEVVGEWGSRRFEVETTACEEIGVMSLKGLWAVACTAAGLLSACSARGCCNNPRCVNLGGVSEMGLVVGREGARGVCSACREVCYCSRKCQEEAWGLHKCWCSQFSLAASNDV
jgi:hypothetical protein